MAAPPGKPLTAKGLLAILGAGLLYLVAELAGVDLTGAVDGWGAPSDRASTRNAAATGEPAPSTAVDDSERIRDLFRARRSGVHVEAEGEVVHLLPDDTRGDQHQLFLLELENGITLKISHNIDVAPRVPLAEGDRVRFRGDYEYNEKGGVVHWTHRNTRGGSHPHGWIVHRGRRYE
jgi:hypothetical protein